MVRTVELDEKVHFSKMMHSMNQMKHEEDLCDFTIKVDSITLQAHKVILSAGSPYFKAMLKHDTIESQEGLVSMKGVDFECVKSCINFIYSGKLDIPDGKTKQLLHVAIMMQLDDAKEAICNILKNGMKPENFYEVKHIAELYDLKDIASKCRLYYQENVMAISSQHEFRNETKADILDLLKSKKFNLNEEEKMTLSLRWVEEKTEQKEVLLDLFNRIKIHDVSTEYLSDLLENHPIVSNDLRLYKMLNAFLVQSLQNASKTAARKESISKDRLILFDDTNDCLRLVNPATYETTKVQFTNFNHLSCFNAVSIDSCIYILCEDKSVYRLNFKDEKSKWKRMRDMNADHGYRPPAVAHYGSIFVIASSSCYPTNDVEVFHPSANNWAKLKDKPEDVTLSTLVSLDESIYCIGGRGGGWQEPINAFCRFTPLTSEWIDLEPMQNAGRGCGAAVVEQRIFVMGGHSSCNEVECYDVTLYQWSSLRPTTRSHIYCAAHHFNGWIFLVGHDEIEKYDIANDRWTAVKLKDGDFNVHHSAVGRLL